MSNEAEPPRIWIKHGVIVTRNEVEAKSCSGIEYVPASAQLAAVEDFRRRAIEAAKKLQIGGLNRTHVYTMLNNLEAIPDEHK